MWQIGPVLELRDEHWDAICAHGLRAYPLEACGLLIGEWQGDRVIRFEPTPNAARSSRTYEVDGRDFLRVERVADDDGLAIIGVVHTHTCLLYTSDAADERSSVDLGGRRIIKKKKEHVVDRGAISNSKHDRKLSKNT